MQPRSHLSKPWLFVCVGALALILPKTAFAEPILQMYVEGATYNTSTEKWEFTAHDTFTLWVIANVDGNGGKGAVQNVDLAISYSAQAETSSSMLNLGVALASPHAYNGFNLNGSLQDANGNSVTRATPTLSKWVTDGSVPIMGNGQELANHGSFGPGIDWQQFSLGTFSGTTDPLGDFQYSLPDGSTSPPGAQINAYTITMSDSLIDPTSLSFDLYDHVQANNRVKYVFAPFSHVGQGVVVNLAPEPAALAIWGQFVVAGAVVGWRRRAAYPWLSAFTTRLIRK